MDIYGRHRQNWSGASFTNISLLASTNGPRTSTDLGEEHSTRCTLCRRRKKDRRAAADRDLMVPLSSFMSAALCLL
ncbi:hypothetical protein EYF80_041674 [Liparis tanakae]|uniref:Uncharacterized protein n=1 Tax=Liparis tanakae TaxID=230148 RepID=A0A4Z2G5E9_9TELE|nr:hypothetical protein EYF80_041674 [Liparis tanakae]